MSAIITFKDSTIAIKYQITKVKEDDGTYSCFIPSFKIAFCSPSSEDIKARSVFMVKSFMKYYDGKFMNIKKLLMDLNKLGFKAPKHDLVMFEALKKNVVPKKTRFSNKNISQAVGQVENMSFEEALV